MNAICVFDPASSYNSAKISGYVAFHQCTPSSETCVIINLSGLPPNSAHGIHIHEEGDLTKGCESLCAHYNPHNKLHGNIRNNGKNRHVGDLVNNVFSDEKGNVKFYYHDDLVSLFEPHSVIGRSVVIHEKPDDLGIYRDEDTPRGKESGKTGNAGKRIACSLIGRTKTDFHISK